MQDAGLSELFVLDEHFVLELVRGRQVGVIVEVGVEEVARDESISEHGLRENVVRVS